MIRIYCEAADAVLKETQTLTAGMTNYPECVLTFSDDWDGFGKAVVVRAGEVEKSVLVVNNKFTVPHECLAESGVNLIVGVSGTNGTQTIPTIWCSCGTIMDSVDIDESAGTGTATPSLVDQMLAYAQEVSEYAEDIDQNVIRSVEANNVNSDKYGVASVGISDTGASENRKLTFTFANLKGRGIEEMIFIPDGTNKNRLQIKFSDNTYLNYDGIKDAIASMDSLESAIEAAEALRVAAEQLRVSAESARAIDETERANAETTRQEQESTRQSNENLRIQQETNRVSAEDNRTIAEANRANAEDSRVAAETERAQEFSRWSSSDQLNGLKAEGYAVGEANGVPVGSDSVYYHNNSKYYAEQASTAYDAAQAIATLAQGYAASAQSAASDASSYSSHPPIIDSTTGNWLNWNGESYEDSGNPSMGAKGDTGAQGAKGDTGAQGAKGEKGEKGDTGDIGATPNFTIGTVTSGQVASATITGTAANPVLNLVIPKFAPSDVWQGGDY